MTAAATSSRATTSAPIPTGTLARPNAARASACSVGEQPDRRHDRRGPQRHLREPRARRHRLGTRRDRQRRPGQLHRHQRRRHRRAAEHALRRHHVINGASATPSAARSPARATSSPGNTTERDHVFGATTNDNVVQGNFIGTDATGMTRLAKAASASTSSAPSGHRRWSGRGAEHHLGQRHRHADQDRRDGHGRSEQLHRHERRRHRGDLQRRRHHDQRHGQRQHNRRLDAGLGNVISGNTGTGLGVASGSNGTIIQGNFIGVDAPATPISATPTTAST